MQRLQTLGQGRENAKAFLVEHTDVALDIERRVREAVGLTAFSGNGEVIEMAEVEGASAGAPAG